VLRPAYTGKKRGPGCCVYLEMKQPCSSIFASFQLWLAHQQDPEKSIRQGGFEGSCQTIVVLFEQAFASCRD